MIKTEESIFAKFEGSKLSSPEQHHILGGTTNDPKGNGTPITSTTSTKPSKTPLSTTTNGDPKPTDPDIGLITP